MWGWGSPKGLILSQSQIHLTIHRNQNTLQFLGTDAAEPISGFQSGRHKGLAFYFNVVQAVLFAAAGSNSTYELVSPTPTMAHWTHFHFWFLDPGAGSASTCSDQTLWVSVTPNAVLLDHLLILSLLKTEESMKKKKKLPEHWLCFCFYYSNSSLGCGRDSVYFYICQVVF